MSLLETAIEAAIKAGESIRTIYQSDDFSVEHKSDDSPLTRADLAANAVIESYLSNTDIPILSEEGKQMSYSERINWKKLWIVDPLDGTKEFIKKNDEFTVNIALVIDNRPYLGVIYSPILNLLYWSDGIKSYKQESVICYSNFDPALAVPLPISRENSTYSVVASRSHLSKETSDHLDRLRNLHESVEIVQMGSSLKICLVAEGVANEYPRFGPTMEWDTAAGHAICLTAGKDILNISNQQSVSYNRENLKNGDFIVR